MSFADLELMLALSAILLPLIIGTLSPKRHARNVYRVVFVVMPVFMGILAIGDLLDITSGDPLVAGLGVLLYIFVPLLISQEVKRQRWEEERQASRAKE